MLKMKRLLSFLFAFIFIGAFCFTALSGCRRGGPETLNPAPETEAPAISPTAAPTPTPNPQEAYRQQNAVTFIDALPLKSTGGIAALGNGIIAVNSCDYSANIATTYVYDIISREIIAEYHYEGLSPTLLGYSHADGKFTYRDYGEDCCYIGSMYDSGLLRIDVPDINGFFSYDCTAYYYIDPSTEKVHTLDISSGESAPMEMDGNQHFYSLESISRDDIIIGKSLLSPFEYEYGLCAFDAKSGKVLLARPAMLDFKAGATIYSVGGSDGFIGIDYDENLNSFLGYSHGGKLLKAELGNSMETGLDYVPIANSSYCMCNYYNEETDYGGLLGSRSYICRLGDNIEWFELSSAGVQGNISNLIYLSEEDLLAGYAFTADGIKAVIIDPQRCEFRAAIDAKEAVGLEEIDEAALNAYSEALYPALDDEERYVSVRAWADRLEAEYSIRIMLANQSLSVCHEADFTIESTSALGSSEIKNIEDALGSLEAALANYPDGFFAQFRNGAGEGGVMFALLGSISNDTGSLAYETGERAWQRIAIDIRYVDLESTLYHEIWHAIENFIETKQPMAFSDDVWGEFNPEGFSYYNDYFSHYSEWGSDMYTYFGDREQGVYFVDAYARTNGREDRARIMEYMSFYPSIAGKLIQYEPIRAKFSYMCEKLRECFDTTGWGELKWEKPLANPDA